MALLCNGVSVLVLQDFGPRLLNGVDWLSAAVRKGGRSDDLNEEK